MTLNENNDENIKEFERNYTEMCGQFLEYASGQFSKIREIQNLHNEKLQEDCQVQLERFIKNDVPDDFSEEVKNFQRQNFFFDSSSTLFGTGLLDPKIWSGLGVSNPNSF